MNRAWLILAGLAVLSLAGAGCSKNHAGEAKGDGEASPRVVSFSPAFTTILFDMGLGDHVVGVTRFCRLPDGVERPRLGDSFSINSEVILGVHPDLVICQTDPDKFRGVRELDPRIRIEKIDLERLTDVPAAIERIGELVGKSDVGKQYRDQFLADIDRIRQLAAGKDHPRVIFVMGTARPVAAGAETFIGDLIVAAGGVNAGADIPGQTRYHLTDAADIARAKPDVIICQSDSPQAEAGDRDYWLQWKQDIPAARTGKVFAVSDPDWSTPSTHLTAVGLKLVAMLHGQTTSAPASNSTSREGVTSGGSVALPSRDATRAIPITTLWFARLHRLLAAAIVGAALAAAGAALQGMLRNPLAEPYLLGVSGGAGVGVLLGLALSAWYALPAWASAPTMAFAGAMLSCLAVYLVAQQRGRLDAYSLILSGVIINTFNAAILLAINLYVDPDRIAQFAYWAMGSLPDSPDRTTLWVCGGCVLAGWAVLFAHGAGYNLLGLGDDVASSSGLHVHRLRIITFAAVGLMTAAAVALAGPIGFLGLIVPHVCRMIVGPEHRRLIIVSGLAGAALLVGAEWLCRSLGRYVGVSLIPVGILTALIGGPFFLTLLRRRFSAGARI